jgi:hypothetical protein
MLNGGVCSVRLQRFETLSGLPEFVPFRADIDHLVILTGLTYLTSLYVGLRRYRLSIEEIFDR